MEENKIFKRLVIFAIAATMCMTGFAVLPTASAASTYYVDPSGSDTTGDGSSGNPWLTIQYAINQVLDSDTINVAAGTYTETVDLKGKELTIDGAGVGNTIIDASSLSGYAISNFGDHTTIRDLTLIGTPDNYGFKVSHVSDVTLENIRVENSKKTGVDLHTIDGATLSNIEVVDTVSGFGIMILDSNDVDVTDIMTDNNPWGGVSVQTASAVSDSISFSGTFDAGEAAPLLFEKDSPNYYDITNYVIPDKFDYVVYDFREGDNYMQWYYQETLSDAKTFANALLSSPYTYSGMLIYDVPLKENYYVIPGMLIQDAVDDATGTTIHVDPGTYSGAVVDKQVRIIGASGGSSIITSGVPYKAPTHALTTGFRLDSGADGTEITDFTINCDVTSNFYFAVFSRGVDDVVIYSFEINDAIQGITNWGGNNWEITNNVLTDTVASGGGGIGIFLGATPPTYRECSGNLVQYNTIYADVTEIGYTSPGIFLGLDVRWSYGDLDTNEEVTNNQIIDNSITGTGNTNEVGIEAGVIGVSGDPVKVAYTMGMVHDNYVQDNTVDGSDYGIYAYVVEDLTIEGNEIKNCATHGISIWDDFTGNINCNEIYGNANYGLYYDPTSTVDATCNWWGSCSGPSGEGPGTGDSVSTNVDFDPWIGKVVANAGGPYSIVNNLTVQFDGSGSFTTGCCGEIVTYEWDFGDGDTSTEQSPTHTYDNGGGYTVNLTVSTETLGHTCSDTDTTIVTIDDTDVPTVQLKYPTGGEILKDTISIEWYAHDFIDGYNLPIYLYLSDDNGESWSLFADNPLENTGEYRWDTTKLPDGTYELIVEALDDEDNIGHDSSEPFEIDNHYEPENNPPSKPAKPSGPTSGKAGEEYAYSTSTTDPDGDQVWYKWDWGDGADSGWLGPYNSSDTVTASHTWDEKRSYEIKVKAKDMHGEESPWSDPLAISMPKNKAINLFLERLIERFPILEQLLQPIYNMLVNLY